MNTLSNAAQTVIDALIDNHTSPEEVAGLVSKDAPEYLETIYELVKYHDSWYHHASHKAGAVLAELQLARWVDTVWGTYEEDDQIVEYAKEDAYYDTSAAYRLTREVREEKIKEAEEKAAQYEPTEEELELMSRYPDDEDDESLFLGKSTMEKIRSQKLLKPKEDEEEELKVTHEQIREWERALDTIMALGGIDEEVTPDE